jgi:hypothetical protein
VGSKWKWWALHNKIMSLSRQHPEWNAVQIAESAGCLSHAVTNHLRAEFHYRLRKKLAMTRHRSTTIKKSK